MDQKGNPDNKTKKKQSAPITGNIFQNIKDILGVQNQKKSEEPIISQLSPPPPPPPLAPIEQKQPFQLKSKFSLLFHNPNDSLTTTNYIEGLIKIGDIETVEDFWKFYCHIYRPQDMQAGSFYLFHQNIKPMWEDKANEGGGRFNIKMKKGYVNKIWEDLILGFIGETCEEKDLLNGLVLQIKHDQDIIQLWVKDLSKARQQAKQKIQDWIAETLGLDPVAFSSNFVYQSHQRKPNTSSLPSRKF